MTCTAQHVLIHSYLQDYMSFENPYIRAVCISACEARKKLYAPARKTHMALTWFDFECTLTIRFPFLYLLVYNMMIYAHVLCLTMLTL